MLLIMYTCVGYGNKQWAVRILLNGPVISRFKAKYSSSTVSTLSPAHVSFKIRNYNCEMLLLMPEYVCDVFYVIDMPYYMCQVCFMYVYASKNL